MGMRPAHNACSAVISPVATSSRRNRSGGGAMNFDATSTREILAMIRFAPRSPPIPAGCPPPGSGPGGASGSGTPRPPPAGSSSRDRATRSPLPARAPPGCGSGSSHTGSRRPGRAGVVVWHHPRRTEPIPPRRRHPGNRAAPSPRRSRPRRCHWPWLPTCRDSEAGDPPRSSSRPGSPSDTPEHTRPHPRPHRHARASRAP